MLRPASWRLAVMACGAVLLSACGQAPATQTTPAPAPARSAATPDGLTELESPPPDAAAPAPLQPSEPFGLAALTLAGPDGQSVRVPVYVASTPAARGRGLMQREVLPDDAGMVFLFPGEHTGGFFMKDTLIPLSILFYGPDGDVRAVLDMEPCTAEPCTIYDPGVPYVGALEVNQGFFDEIGLDTDWAVDLPEGLPQPQ